MCEKLQSAMVNPSAVNPIIHEFVDGDTPSMSSDDALALHSTASPMPLEDGETQVTHIQMHTYTHTHLRLCINAYCKLSNCKPTLFHLAI